MPYGEHMITTQLEDMYMRYHRRLKREETYIKKTKHKEQSNKNNIELNNVITPQLKVS